jgi:hypothetical protein
MSDEVKATGYDCCDNVGGENNWLQWIIIIFIIFWFLGGDNNWLGGRGGCR